MRVAQRALRTTRLAASTSSPVAGRRSYSDHHDAHHSSTTDEPTGPEGFGSAAWRNAAIGGVALYGVYHFLPSSLDPENSITKLLAKFETPSTVWSDMNTERTIAMKELADGKLLSQSAEKPPIQRSRFPMLLDQASPRLVGVGQNVDVSTFRAKRDGQ